MVPLSLWEMIYALAMATPSLWEMMYAHSHSEALPYDVCSRNGIETMDMVHASQLTKRYGKDYLW